MLYVIQTFGCNTNKCLLLLPACDVGIPNATFFRLTSHSVFHITTQIQQPTTSHLYTDKSWQAITGNKRERQAGYYL